MATVAQSYFNEEEKTATDDGKYINIIGNGKQRVCILECKIATCTENVRHARGKMHRSSE